MPDSTRNDQDDRQKRQPAALQFTVLVVMAPCLASMVALVDWTETTASLMKSHFVWLLASLSILWLQLLLLAVSSRMGAASPRWLGTPLIVLLGGAGIATGLTAVSLILF